MKIKNAGYLVKQGLQSISRNKMMSLASVSTVMASLLILGIYFIAMMNVNAMVKGVESGVEIKVFLTNDITNEQMNDIESEMKNTSGVTDVTYESKEQALENFKKQLGENADLVDGIDADEVMPSSYIIKMKGPEYVEGTVAKLKGMPGVDEIKDAQPIMDKLIDITGFVRTLGISLMAILLIVSIFLISNTIKLTVMSRRREIGIMKYIGATDWFIRWPFVIEGLILGLLGAIVSGIILGYGYVAACDAVAQNLFGVIKLMEPKDIVPNMSAMFAVVGLAIGSLGSMLSMRKFLHV